MGVLVRGDTGDQVVLWLRRLSTRDRSHLLRSELTAAGYVVELVEPAVEDHEIDRHVALVAEGLMSVPSGDSTWVLGRSSAATE